MHLFVMHFFIDKMLLTNLLTEEYIDKYFLKRVEISMQGLFKQRRNIAAMTYRCLLTATCVFDNTYKSECR